MKISSVVFNSKFSDGTHVLKDKFNNRNPNISLHCSVGSLNNTSEIISFGSMLNKSNIKLFDCTLRDGGFINNWNFGHNKILEIFQQLVNAKVDVVEIGYLGKKETENVGSLDRTRFPNTEAIAKIFESVRKKETLVSAMIDYGDCDIENVGLKKDGVVDIIRIAFKKNNVDGAIKFAKSIKEKGYNVFIQPASITSYSEEEMLNLIKKVNGLEPKCMSIVDTYGLLDKKNLKKYFNLLNKNLKKNIDIGFHSHNNMQLGFANSIELADEKTRRKIYLDASLYGMGKSAGNTNTELLTMELDRNYGKKYDIDKILEIIDSYIAPYQGENKWGYSLNYFIATLNSCHPNYVKFLREKPISVTQINKILRSIEKDKKLQFDEEYIKDLYLKDTSGLNLQA